MSLSRISLVLAWAASLLGGAQALACMKVECIRWENVPMTFSGGSASARDGGATDGGEADAGEVDDGGVPEVRSLEDAGRPNDAGSEGDAGSGVADAGRRWVTRCAEWRRTSYDHRGCSAGGGAPLALAVPLLLLLRRRRSSGPG